MKLFDEVAVACDLKMIEEANAIRAVLESFRLRVRFHRFVRRRNVVEFFGDSPGGCEYTVLVCHGMGDAEEPKIRFEVVDQAEGKMDAPEGWEDAPFDLTPSTITKVVAGARGTLVSVACGSGRKPLAEAFLAAGYEAYVAPVEEYYDGDSAVLFVAGFFYHLLAEDRDYAPMSYTAREATERAAAMDEHFELGTRAFRYHGKDE